MTRVLMIGQSSPLVNQAIILAKKSGARVTLTPDINNAVMDLASGKGADVVLIDVMQDISQFISDIASQHISVPVVGYGLNADKDRAAYAIKSGAVEYLPLPPDEQMIAAILQMISDNEFTMIGNSPEMQDIKIMADRIAASEASVLITGESGTGKEVLCKYIQAKSKRSAKPYITLNCAAIPETLMESELFGHEKGAFTGALTRRIGKFEEAQGGTILLDEISEMDVRLQAKLLRALQEREIVRVGGTNPIKLDIRIIATSNRDLKKSVDDGTFREDLWFRLNVVTFQLPPLRDRKEDLIPLAEHFIAKYAEINGVSKTPALDKSAIDKMLSYSWPGNIRELENTMHRAVLMHSGGVIDENAIRLEMQQSQSGTQKNIQANIQANVGADKSPIYGSNGFELVGKTIESVEQEMIVSTLKHVSGNRTHAAKILGISIRTLRNKLKTYSESGLKIVPEEVL